MGCTLDSLLGDELRKVALGNIYLYVGHRVYVWTCLIKENQVIMIPAACRSTKSKANYSHNHFTRTSRLISKKFKGLEKNI